MDSYCGDLGITCQAGSRSVTTLTSLYRTISQRTPTVKGGRLHNSPPAATLQLELPDVENNTKTRIEQSFCISGGNAAAVGAPVPVDSKVVQWLSPSGRRAVRFITNTAGDDKVIQLCRADDLLSVEAVVPLKKAHGPILEAPHFQNVDWSEDETRVVYCAEATCTPAPKLWGDARKENDDTTLTDSNRKDGAAPRSAFEAVQTFGEALKDFTMISLFVVDFKDRTVVNILPSTFTSDYSAVSPSWTSTTGSHVAFVAVPHSPIKLGLAHCCNRPAKLHVISLLEDKSLEEVRLPPGHHTLRNLRRRGTRIAALSPAPTAAHASGATLVVFEAKNNSAEEMQVVVPIPAAADQPAQFPGLYPATGSDIFWVDDAHLIVSSIYRSSVQLFLVAMGRDHPAAVVSALQFDDASRQMLGGAAAARAGTMNVLHNDGSRFLLSFSTATVPPSVFYVDNILAQSVHLVPVRLGSNQLPNPGLTTSVLETSITGRRVESLFHHHVKVESGRPLVLFVHGGPHTTDTGSFLHGIFFYLICGMNVLSVNYGGSLGFGQDQVDELLGHAGENDVADVVAALRHAQQHFLLDGPVIVSGGSHGGFLTAHLSSRYGDLFRAAIMRNPVIDIGSMWFATDIPDWCLTESGAQDISEVGKMFAASPSGYCRTMTVPTIIGIGLNDLRVPISQGRSWFHLIRKMNPSTPVRLLEYPGTGHSMDSPQAALDFAVHSMLFAWSFL